MAKRSKRKRRREPRTSKAESDRATAAKEALWRQARPRNVDPAGVLAALQVNPPIVKGHITEAARQALKP